MEWQDVKKKAVELIADYEDFIRVFITSALKDAYSDWREGILNKASIKGEGMLDRWKERRKSALDKGVSIHQSLIAQADFSDYKQIIEYRKNWGKIFSEIFLPSNKNRLSVYMEDIADFRHKISHSKGDISEVELHHIQHEINWIKAKAGVRYPSLLTDRRFDTKREDLLSVDIENISSDLQIYFNHLLNRCTREIEEGEQQGVQDSFSDIASLAKKEIDKSNKEHVIFILQQSFLKTYKHVYDYPFILQNYFDLFEYSYKKDKQLGVDIIKAFEHILDSEVYSTQDVEKVEPLADLFLGIGIAFLNRDPGIPQRCFYSLINSSEMMWSRVLFSKLLIAGAKLVQFENPPDEIKNLRDEVIGSIEYNDAYAKDERYFTYIEDAFFYLDDEEFITTGKSTASKYDISKGEFYDKYLKSMMDKNMDKEVKDYINYLEEFSRNPEQDYSRWFDDFEEFLSEIDVAYEANEDEYQKVWDKISKILADKIVESKNSNFEKMLEEFAVIQDSLVSNLIKKAKNRLK